MIPRASFNSYGKIDPDAQARLEAKRRERKRLFIIICCSVFLTIAIVSLAIGIVVGRKQSNGDTSSSSGQDQYSSGALAIQTACNTTPYVDTCVQTLTSYNGSLSASPLTLVSIAIKIALDYTQSAAQYASDIATQLSSSSIETKALQDCYELLSLSSDDLVDAIDDISSISLLADLQSAFQQIEVILSTASAEQTACSDNMENITGSGASAMLARQEKVNEVILNSLALVETLSNLGSDLGSWKNAVHSIPSLFHFRRRLLQIEPHADSYTALKPQRKAYTQRIASHGRRLLDSISSLTPNATVSKDNSGEYDSLTVALNNIPENYSGHYVIYIKAGVYDEGPVNISKTSKNLVLLGDGCNKTVITGNASVQPITRGYTTYRSATVGIAAKGFIARGITFRNEAGPDGHQAVALRSNAQQLVFDNCCFEGYQDTLYTLSGEQYYRDCTIAGTVDFIFGDALAAFQNCTLVARKPIQYQQNTYTAQGKKVDSTITGLFFQDCNLIEGEDLKSANFTVETYLGRPWKTYSTTLFMTSAIGSHVNSQGWLSWNTSNPFEDTCFYGEYANTGPGSDTSNRVNWTCVHSEMNATQASNYAVSKLFVDQTSFIPSDVTVDTTV